MPTGMTEEQALVILQEVDRRFNAGAGASIRARILAELFPEQRAYFEDDSRAKALKCTRRAGKTFVVADDLVATAAGTSGDDCLAIYPTAKQGKRVMWDGPEGLKSVERRHHIGMRFHNTDMVAMLPNGSKVLVGGAETRDDIEQYLGQKYKKIVLDEAQAFKPHIDELLETVLQPTLVDLQGSLVLCGVPGRTLVGIYYDVTRNELHKRSPGWNVHSWSVLNNPHLPHAATEMEYIKSLNGWTNDTPKYIREWLGRWALESDTLIYKFKETGCTYTGLPDNMEFRSILSIDLGYDDDTAFRITLFSDESDKSWLGERFKAKGMTPSEVAAKIKYFDNKHHPERMIADTGGLGKQVISEYNKRHGIGVFPAQKKQKADFIEMMNDDFAGNRIMVPEGDPIIEEWANLQWQDDDAGRKIEDPRFDNHEADAALYGWREARAYLYVPLPPPPPPGTTEYWEAEEARQLAAEMAEFENAKDTPWWDKPIY